MNRKELDRIRMLPVLGIVLAVFLSFGISVFATEDGVGDIPAEGDVLEAEAVVEEPAVTTENLAEPEELLDDYIQVRTKEYADTHSAVSFDAKGGIVKNKLRGERLTGVEKKAYDLLKAEIEKVAAGEINDTQFTLTFDQLFSEELLATRYTAEDLGLDDVTYLGYDEEDGQQYTFPTDEATEAVLDRYTIDLPSVVTALVYDCPYCLYWYDKTVGSFYRRNGYVFPEYNSETKEWSVYCLGDESVINIYFAVSLEYAPQTYKVEYFNEKPGPIQTDSEKIQTIDDAITEAGRVVSYASANKATDYDKLDYYREWICDNVDYNHDAMEDEETPYGNPWQLIYVFDGIDETEVVCEGYSKAFKYLCDLTDTFADENIDCRLVTGNMDGGTGAGPHMWNLVEIGGENYLVDVTNCDEGSVGCERYLFMRGNEALSAAGYTINIPARGNYNEANIEYVYDSDTRSTFEDNELQLSLTDTYEPPCAHDYREVPGSAEEPTCTKAGKDADQKCSICQNLKEGKAIPALDHDWKEATCTTPKTCERCKATEGEALGHDYSVDVEGTAQAATCTEAGKEANKKCSRCDDEKVGATIPALDHDWKEATCTTPKTCERCKETEGEALGHKWDEGVVTTAPTVDSEGIRTYTCTVCNTQKNESIAKLPKPVAVPTGKTLTYNAKAQTGVVAEEGYTLSGMSATNAGSYTATAKLKSGYIWKDGTTAAKKISWKINKLAISKATMSGIAGKVYTGKAIAQNPFLKFAGTTLKKGTDYKLSYKNNLKVGRASVTISGYGNFSGSVTKTFNINPKGASLKTPAALKKGMTVYWNRQTAKMSTARITGYQVQIATDANFKKSVKTYTIKGYNSASRKITGLKGKTKYYVRIRTYQTLKISGKNTNFFSGWSAKKAVTTKN